MTATDNARVDGGGAPLKGIGATAPDRKVPDRNWERDLIGRWRNGAGTERLAQEFAVPLTIVEALVKTQIRLREARPQDFDDVTGRLSASAARYEGAGPPAMAGGDGQPKFACHGEHVAAVMAQGGYPAAVGAPGGTMMFWPDLDARKRSLGR